MSLKLEHVSYLYGTDTTLPVRALDDICLEIPDGQFIGLIGHTGSGKSTLVQHLNGLLEPSEGILSYNGRNIWEKDFPRKELRSKVGLVFQYPEHQLFEVDVFSDVCFGPKNLGLSKEETERRARRALELVGFPKEFYGQSPFELSGGQKRRVAIAGVLAMRPDCIVLDEATAMLDPKGRRQVMETIDKLRAAGVTIVSITHYMEEAARADRVLVMNAGRIVMEGTPEQIFAQTERLHSYHLDVPQAAELRDALEEIGLPAPRQIITPDAAADWLYELLK